MGRRSVKVAEEEFERIHGGGGMAEGKGEREKGGQERSKEMSKDQVKKVLEIRRIKRRWS